MLHSHIHTSCAVPACADSCADSHCHSRLVCLIRYHFDDDDHRWVHPENL